MSALIVAGSVAGNRDHGQYLTFGLGSEIYGVGILAVKEIIEYGQLTVVPMMPACTRGVINLRGAVVPVIDLSSRFGRTPTAVGRRSCIVIVEIQAEDGSQIMGIIVDAVNEVLEISADQIEPPPSFGTRIRSDFISGMARAGGGFIVLLNIARVLSLDDLAALAQLPESLPELAAA